jgi:pimeloyl-ACP methyl ester carboxylesterase
MHRSRNYWRNLALFTLVVTLLAFVGMTVGLAYSRALVLVHPTRHHTKRTPAMVGLVGWETVTFYAPDGVRLEGWFVPPQAEHRAVIVFVHGLATNRAHWLDEAALLARHGYGALLFDLRNHGASEGTLTTFGYFEVEDVRGAIEYLSARADVDSQRIALMGHSMGAGTVLLAGARIARVRAVIAQSAYASIEDNIAEGVEGLTGLPACPFAPLVIWFGERAAGVSIRQVRPIDEIANISPRAVMLIHGQDDPLIPVRNARRLYQAAREPKELYIIPAVGHVGLLQANPLEYERRVTEFLRRALLP